MNEWQDKKDQVYLIDSRLTLFKFSLERECLTLDKVGLNKHIQDRIEKYVRATEFARMSITDRCISFNGKTINYRTGYEWDYIYTS